MSKIQKIINQLHRKIAAQDIMINMLTDLESHDLPEGVRIRSGLDSIIIEFTDLGKINAARSVAKSLCPTWRDKLTQVWYSSSAITSWQDEANPLVQLWFKCSIDEYPDSLKKSATCKWVKNSHEDYSFVCEVN